MRPFPCLISPQVTVHFIPAPSFVLLCQVFASTVVVKGCAMFGALEADELEWDKVGSSNRQASKRSANDAEIYGALPGFFCVQRVL